MPTVQAIVPAFNPEPAFLRQAVESCLAQPSIVGVIVVDDGSSRPVELATDPRVRVLRQANAGPSAARNRALDELAADYALLLDHDDSLEPDSLGPALSLAARLDAAAVVSARYELRRGVRTFKGVPEEWKDGLLPSPGEVFRPLALFGASGALIAARTVRAGVRFDPSLMIGEDREFLRRIALHGPIAVSGHPLLTVRLHDDGANLSSPAHLARRVRDHLIILGRHHEAHSDRPLEQQTIWLLNQLSKQAKLDGESWRLLLAAARGRGWSVPLKPRIRARLRGFARV